MKNPAIPSRFVQFMLVVVLHIAIAYALIAGTAYEAIALLMPPMQVEILHEKKPPPPENTSPPALPKLNPPPVMVPVPEVVIDTPVQSPIVDTKTIRPDDEKKEPPPVVRNAAEETATGPMKDAWLDTRKCRMPDIPWQAKNEDHEPVGLLLLVDVDGLVVESKIEKSSGDPYLDQAALDALKICKYSPATVGGTPVRKWKKISVVWDVTF
jgi:protein TonB